eukprot:6200813-Pleurochrysis_carterae.AAC.2
MLRALHAVGGVSVKLSPRHRAGVAAPTLRRHYRRLLFIVRVPKRTTQHDTVCSMHTYLYEYASETSNEFRPHPIAGTASGAGISRSSLLGRKNICKLHVLDENGRSKGNVPRWRLPGGELIR